MVLSRPTQVPRNRDDWRGMWSSARSLDFALVQWPTQPAGEHGEPSRRELIGLLRERGAGLARYSGLEAA